MTAQSLRGRGARATKITTSSIRAALSVGDPAGSRLPRSSGPGRMADGGDAPDRSPSPATSVVSEDEPHRSPIALALSADGTRLLAANQTAGTVSLVD